MEKLIETYTIPELENMIDNHDCHYGSEDSCMCQEWRDMLVKKRNQLFLNAVVVDDKGHQWNSIDELKDWNHFT